jgi:acyl carrier protein
MPADGHLDEVADSVIEIAAGVFEIDGRTLGLDASPATVERWDSLNHLKLITAVESAFAIRLPMKAVLQIDTIRKLIEAVGQQRRE